MANVIVESKGNVTSLKDDITGVISLQEGDNIYEANYKGKQLKFEINNLKFLGAENFLDSNNLIYKGPFIECKSKEINFVISKIIFKNKTKRQ